ncbi:MAG: hypothetical protein QXH08_06335 [Candidatus Hadarchaeales archaeon]
MSHIEKPAPCIVVATLLIGTGGYYYYTYYGTPRCEAVVEGIQKGIPPPKEGAENGWECLFCEHFRECHAGGLKNPRPVKEWEIYRGGAADEAAVKSLWEGMMRGEEILVLTDNDEWAAKERLLRDGVPFTAVLAKPPSYDMRWYEKVYEAIGGGESGGRTTQRP